MMKHILIAGAKGYVGKNLAHLLNKNEEIRSIGLYRDGFTYTLDLYGPGGGSDKVWCGKLSDIDKPLRDLNIDVIVNLVADTTKNPNREDISKLIDSNCTFAILLAEVATQLNVERYVYVSTYSTHMDSAEFSPQTLYAATKKATEDLLTFYAQSKSLPITILKPYDIYGPFQPHKRLIPTLVKSVLSNSDIELLGGEQEVCPIFIDDVLSGIEHVIWRRQLEQIDFVSLPGSQIFKVKDLPKIISEYLGKQWAPNKVKISKNYRENEIMKVNQAYKTLPDWAPRVNLELGVKKMQKEEFFE
jgi:nucleoside-diphosphate-sugar epimerase